MNHIAPHIAKLYEDALLWDTHSGFMPDPAADLENLVICYPDFWERSILPGLLQPPSTEPPTTG